MAKGETLRVISWKSARQTNFALRVPQGAKRVFVRGKSQNPAFPPLFSGIYARSRRSLAYDRPEERPMKGLLAVLLLGLLGCGAGRDSHLLATISATSNSPLSVSGFVSSIQMTPSATGSNSTATVVTFIPQLPQNAPTSTLTFCGNVANNFVLNTFATVQFTRGPGCATIVSALPMAFVTITGSVSIVQVTTANNGLVTMVTLILQSPQTGLAETLPFCGNVAGQFPVNGLMTVSFTQGQTCSNVVSDSAM